jgi:hypothetical protein
MNESDTKHRHLLSKRIPLGAIALILAGLALLPQGVLTANVPSAPEQNIEFASGANSLGYRLSMMLVVVSLALFILGVLGSQASGRRIGGS